MEKTYKIGQKGKIRKDIKSEWDEFEIVNNVDNIMNDEDTLYDFKIINSRIEGGRDIKGMHCIRSKTDIEIDTKFGLCEL